MKTNFYDIESLDNVFSLCNYKDDEDIIDVYYLVDDPILISSPTLEKDLTEAVYKANHNFRGKLILHNLYYPTANDHLAETFGLSDASYINNPNNKSIYPSKFRITCDTDLDYDEDKHPYYMGYNSYNYDTTMLTMYLHEVYQVNNNTVHFVPTNARLMRDYNDDLFLPEFKDSMPTRLLVTRDIRTNSWTPKDYTDIRFRIRKNMLMSGRHIDVARLNEKQQRVGLKRLLGMLGHQILESSKLKPGATHINTPQEFYDLIAYNVSDVVNLKSLLHHKAYWSKLTIKRRLLKTYPELVYDRIPGQYKPDIRPEAVRKDRLTADSSSAQLATKALCPYDHLKDIPTVSFMYPSERKAKELGIPRVNVLEETKKFFYTNFPQPELRAQFDKIYNYYKSIEGKNFNDSKFYYQDYGKDPNYQEPLTLSKIPKDDNCICYFDAQGKATSCFATLSTGGVHGAEYNLLLFLDDLAKYDKAMADLDYVKTAYPDPIDCKKAKLITLPDGREEKATKFLMSGATNKKAFYKKTLMKQPILFIKLDDGSTKLNSRYTYTSADLTNHEDFTSYYPNLLRMLDAFYNIGLGYDRYAEIFDDKQRYGKLMKDPSLTQKEIDDYDALRNGTKLILNSASGAADAKFESSIRVNNQIISMRIIGQLFTYRIAQAQTIHGARITSTNTDGLYSVLEATLNNQILEKESSDINVEIEPEPIYLITKDTNNRLEVNAENGEILKANGGSLACRKAPDPEKSLAHPAIIDWALSEYLLVSAFNYKGLSIDKDFDETIGMNILKSAKDKFEPAHLLQMYQNVIASSIGTINHIFATTHEKPDNPIIMQHYNRVFIMKDNTPDTVHLYAANARKVTPAQIKKRKENQERIIQHDEFAKTILSAYGVKMSDYGTDKEATIKKVTGIENTWFMFIENKSLYALTDDEIWNIYNNLDLDKYLILLKNAYEENWRNHVPQLTETAESLDENTKTSNTETVPEISETECFLDKSVSDLLAEGYNIQITDKNGNPITVQTETPAP